MNKQEREHKSLRQCTSMIAKAAATHYTQSLHIRAQRNACNTKGIAVRETDRTHGSHQDRDNRQDAAVAQAEAAVANYASTALSAWGEVENAVAADRYLADQEEAQARALEEARRAEELALRKYTTSGTLTIFNLIDAQTRRLTAESQLISVRASRATNRISYNIALGGGLPVRTASTETTPTEAAAE